MLLRLFFLYAVLLIVFRFLKCENLERTSDDDDSDDAEHFGPISQWEFRWGGCGRPPGSG